MQTDKSRYLLGLTVITAGAILLLNNLSVTDINIWRYWPVLIIIWGMNSLFTGSRNLGAQVISLFVMLLGVVLLTNSLKYTDFNFRQLFEVFIPLLIILIGAASLFFGRSFSGKSTLAILGGVERGKNTPWQLESGSYLAIMGGIELDLRHAIIPEGETVLDLTAVMGGIEVRIPADLPASADGFAILGGLEFFGKASGGIIGSAHNEQGVTANDDRVLKIQARTVMGGIEIKKI